MKNETKPGKALTKKEMAAIVGGFGVGEQCGTHICSKYQACCSTQDASGNTVYYCTTTACF